MAGRKRSNGEGTIKARKLKNGDVVYDAWASVKDPITGQTKRVPKRGHKSHDDAVEWIQQQRTAATRPVANGMKLDDLANVYWQSGAVGPSTMVDWEQRYKVEIQPYLGQIGLKELLPLHIDSWVGKMRGKLVRGKVRKPTSLINYVTTLSAILKYGVINKLLDADWTETSPAVRKLRDDAMKTEPEKKSPWTYNDFKNFLRIETEPSYKAMWLLMAATGVRRGHACGLKWVEVDFEDMVIRFGTNRVAVSRGVVETIAKAGRRIIVPMDEALANVLREQRKRQIEEGLEDCKYVFDRPVLVDTYKQEKFEPGEPMDPNGVTARFRRLRRRANLKSGSPHTLRHLWATLARELGASRDAVADVLGNSSKIVAEVYDHSDKEQRELASKMASKMLTS
jgi:integrase